MQFKYLIAYSEKVLRYLSTVTSYHLLGVQTQSSAIESLVLEYQLHSLLKFSFFPNTAFLCILKTPKPSAKPSSNRHCCFFPKLFASFICYKILQHDNYTIFLPFYFAVFFNLGCVSGQFSVESRHTEMHAVYFYRKFTGNQPFYLI